MHTIEKTSPMAALSGRELEIMQQIGIGRSNTEIAESMYLSVNTVKTHIRGAYRKLGLSRRVEAVIWAGAHLRELPAPGRSDDDLPRR